MASTIFFSFAMSFLLAKNILLKSGLPDFGAEARLPSQPYSPAPSVHCCFLFRRNKKAIRSLLIAAIKGTEWLNFGGTTLLNQNFVPILAHLTSVNAGNTLHFHAQLQGRFNFQGHKSLAPYGFLSGRVSKFTDSSLRLFCFLLFDVLKSNAGFLPRHPQTQPRKS